MINLNKLAVTQLDVSDKSMTEATSMTRYSIVVTRQEPQVAAELVRHSRILPWLRVLPRKTSFQRFQREIFHFYIYGKSLGICKLETVLYIHVCNKDYD